MRRLDDSRPFPSLLFRNLSMQLLHFRPVQFGTEMVFRVVTVVEPERIVNLLVRTHAPGDWFIRIPTKMQVISIQVREAMPEVVEG